MSPVARTKAKNKKFPKPKLVEPISIKPPERVEKAPTGIAGLEFLVNGAREYAEPGVFVTFEETTHELAVNAASLRFDLEKLAREGLLAIDHVHIDPNEIAETGEYDLEGLFTRLKYAIESVGAKRVVLDTIEALFSGFSNTAILRAEIRRLFQFLKSFGVTAIVTGERGENSLTRYGLEEYVCAEVARDEPFQPDSRVHSE